MRPTAPPPISLPLILPIVRTIQASGVISFAGIAEALNARGVRTARGGDWHASTVRNTNQAFWRHATLAMSDTPSGHNTATELTKERNRLAADRTLMAWIRTSLSLIGFGFGIGKVYEYLKSVGI